jgi:hypothetical protein
MQRLFALLCAGALLACCSPPKDPHTLGYGDLPNPPINLFHTVDGNSRASHAISRSRGIVNFGLSKAEPSHTFWNDPDTQRYPWGTITLQNIEKDGTVVVSMSGNKLRAKPGRAFPGTGIVVVESDSAAGTALMRSKFTLTVMHGDSSPID